MHRSFATSCLYIAATFWGYVAHAQDCAKSELGIEANLLVAKVAKHTAKFKAPIPAISSALDVNFTWKTNGKKDWHIRRHCPKVGLGMTYTDYGDNQVYGNCLAVYTNVEIPLIRRDNFEWTMRIGDGVGYVTRKYQTVFPVDTLNNAIGSHLNDFGILMSDLRYRVDCHWLLQGGINLTHISNGGTASPNLGVNTVGIHAGAIYYPGKNQPKPVDREVPKLKNRWLIQARMDFSYKKARTTDSPYLASYMPSVYISRRYKGKNKLFFGVDYAFHNDVLAFMRHYDVHAGHQRQESWDGYIFAGNEFMLGRVGVITQLGVNYKSTFLKFDPYCEKLGGHLYLFQNEKGIVKETFISTLLLAHALTAELVEFGLGVGF